jgi:DNA-binding response OmpR family regulator
MSHATLLITTSDANSRWRADFANAASALGPITFVDAEHAREHVQNRAISLVVIDASFMPSDAVLDELRTWRRERGDICLVVASASPTWRRAREVLDAGADHYMTKSIDPERIRADLDTALRLAGPTGWRHSD